MIKTLLAHDLIAMHKLLKSKGIREAHLMLLLFLEEHGPSLVGEVQRSIGTSPAMMSRLLKRLERGGLITREINAKDYRSFLLSVTPKGSAIVNEVARCNH